MDWLGGLFNLGRNIWSGASKVGQTIANPVQSALSYGVSQLPNIFNSFMGGKTGQPNYSSNMFQNLFSGGGSSALASKSTAPSSPSFQGPSTYGGKSALSIFQNMMQGGQARPAQPQSQNISSAFKNFAGNLMSPSGYQGGYQQPQPPQPPQIPPTGGQTAGQTKPGAGNFLTNLFTPTQQGGMGMLGQNPAQTLGGMGMQLAGSMLNKGPKMPDLSQLPSVKALQNMKLGIANMQQLDPELQAATENDLKKIEDEEMRDFTARYKNLRPGADIESDSVYKRDRQALLDEQASRRVDTLAKVRRDYIQTQINANDQEMQQLEQLAQYDQATLMGQFGMDAQESENFKEIFGNLGGALMSQGLGLTQGAQ